MKVVFLDIDGVLNYRSTSLIDSTCLSYVLRVAQETQAKFVLSSSWREILINAESNVNEHSRRLLSWLMNESGLEFVGWTPLDSKDRRELEIQQWLNENGQDVEQFVIIDDLEYDFRELFPDNFIKTAGYWGNGMTSAHADEAIRILNSH